MFNNAADELTDRVDALGPVTLDKEESILAARKAYDALSPEAKTMVPETVQSKLTAAEKKLASLKKEEALKKKNKPAKITLKKVKAGKRSVKLTWKKAKKATGYQVYMSTKKTSGFKKIATIKKAKTVTYTKKKLKSGKTYYFRIRAMRKVGKKTYYGAYSTVKKAKVK